MTSADSQPNHIKVKHTETSFQEQMIPQLPGLFALIDPPCPGRVLQQPSITQGKE